MYQLKDHQNPIIFEDCWDQSWVFFGRTDAEAATPILWPPLRRVDSLEKTLMLGGIGDRRKGDDRGWDGWMASPTWCTWVWVNSGSWWWTRRPGLLQFMRSQSDVTEWLNWTEADILNTWSPLTPPFLLSMAIFPLLGEDFWISEGGFIWQEEKSLWKIK